MSPHEKEVVALAAKVEKLHNESKRASRKARRPVPNNNEMEDGIKRGRKPNPRSQNGYIKTNHPKRTQSSSIIFGITLSGIGVVKNPKDTAEEYGGHIY